MDDICFDKCMRCDAVIVSDATAVAALKADNEKLRAEIIQLEKWNGEIAFNARLFADALKRIDRMEAWKTQDSWDVLWAKIGIMRDIARAALGGAND